MFNNKPATQGTVNNNSFPTTLGNFLTSDSSVGLFGNRSQNVDNKQQKGANDNNNISTLNFRTNLQTITLSPPQAKLQSLSTQSQLNIK